MNINACIKYLQRFSNLLFTFDLLRLFISHNVNCIWLKSWKSLVAVKCTCNNDNNCLADQRDRARLIPFSHCYKHRSTFLNMAAINIESLFVLNSTTITYVQTDLNECKLLIAIFLFSISTSSKL